MPKWTYVAALLAALTGCSSRSLIDSQPQGANVYVDDRAFGPTPVTVEFDTFWDDDKHLRVSKPGYCTDERVVSKVKESIWTRRQYPSSIFIRLVPSEETPVACKACGKTLVRDAMFCGGCGARRP